MAPTAKLDTFTEEEWDPGVLTKISDALGVDFGARVGATLDEAIAGRLIPSIGECRCDLGKGYRGTNAAAEATVYKSVHEQLELLNGPFPLEGVASLLSGLTDDVVKARFGERKVWSDLFSEHNFKDPVNASRLAFYLDRTADELRER